MRAVAVAAAVVALLAFVPPAAAASGGLDPTFGAGGVAAGPFASAAAIASGPGGRVIVGGELSGRGGHPLAVAAYSAGGALDPGFGQRGVATAPATGLAGVAAAAGGEITAVGYRTRGGRREPALARFSASGALAGVTGGPVGDGDALPRSLALAPDGSALVACDAVHAGEPVIAIVRYSAGGAPDPGFGTAYVGLPGRAVTTAGIALGSGGALTVAGTAYDPTTGDTDPLVARLPPGGGSGSRSPVVVPTRLDGVRAVGVAVAPDGSATVAASGREALRSELVAVRVNAAGSVDDRFGDGGVVALPIGSGDAFATGVSVDSTGAATLIGQATDGASSRQTLIRLLPDGALDPAFAPPDPDLVPSAGLDSRPVGVATDAAGRLLVAGSTFAAGIPQVALARYSSGG